MSRRKARETAFQMLFQLMEGANDWLLAENTLAEKGLSEAGAAFAAQLAKGAWQKHFETEHYIRRLAKGWQYERLCSVDRLVLHLAMYELKYLPATPAPVAIDEAIELAREFGTDDSPAFVNAVLDSFLRLVLAAEDAEDTEGRAEYRLNEEQLRQAEERLRHAEAAQAEAAQDRSRAAEQAWADKKTADALAASRRAAEKKVAKHGGQRPPAGPVGFRKIRKADITEADRILPEPD